MKAAYDFEPDLHLAFAAGVIPAKFALSRMTPDALRWQIDSGRWQRPCRGVLVNHSGPLSREQALWAAILWAGPGTAIGGLTAARLWGLTGFDDADQAIHLVLPAGREQKRGRLPFPATVHYSRRLTSADVHPTRQPPRTRLARSVIDCAAWGANDRGAQAVLAASVQQRLLLPEHLATELERNRRVRRRRLLTETVGDIAGGSQALSELDFLNRVVRPFGLPSPDRQAPRLDAEGRRRWLDAVWDEAGLIVEVDGAGHADILRYWADMDRDNQLKLPGYDTLRYPAFAIRYQAGYVAGQIRAALARRGVSC